MRIIQNKILAGKMLSVFAVLFSLSLTSCLPIGPESVNDFDVVATFYNKDYNFQKNKTYAMPDEIAHIAESGSNDDISRDHDPLIIKQIEINMEALGYTKVDTTVKPDVILTVAITVGERNLYGEYSLSDYWGSWFVSYGYDYGNEMNYNYPNYGSTDYYGLRFGTLLIHMADHEIVDAGDTEVSAQWIGLINGMAGDSFSGTSTRLINSISQCFEQSPYLAANNN